MPAVRFIIDTTFDLPGRGGILTPGRLLAGRITAGTVLRSESTGQEVHVLSVEFPTPKQRGTDQVTLLIDRKDLAALTEGAVLISQE
jgi:hypothetical protein